MEISTATISSFDYQLFKSESERISKMTLELHEKNETLLGIFLPGFKMSGKIYQVRSRSKLGNQALSDFPSLHFTLREEGNNLLQQMDKLNIHKSLIRQMLLRISMKCNDAQDFRDAITESIVRMFNLSHLPRSRSEAWLFADNARDMKQYNRIADLIAFYTAMQLMN